MLGMMRMRWLLTLLPRTINYLFNERVPFFYKLIMLLPILWLFTPIARLSSAVPVLGLLDEFTVVLLSMALFTHLVSRYLLSRIKKDQPATSAPLEIIEGEYYVIDRQPDETKKKAT